ncbi:hypothetical protein SAMN06309944_1415 [Micrococcales bacterium KH10]|nr:hypothetical protein SAMN06309944_1415 [Micrococcales bacterium KH10]
MAAMQMLTIAAPGALLVVSSLSRLSHNLDKMLRMLEIILSRGATLLTTNSMIRAGEAFTRSGGLVAPDSWNPYSAISETRGLAGIHRTTMRRSPSYGLGYSRLSWISDS